MQNDHGEEVESDKENALTIDFVLAFNKSDEFEKKRLTFEKNLEKEGLILERDDHFVKIHATKEILSRYADILNFKFPIKLDEKEKSKAQIKHEFKIGDEEKSKKTIFEKFYQTIRLNHELFPKKKYELYHEYTRDKSYLFNTEDSSISSHPSCASQL